jgi:hypothetical protein
LTFGADVRPVLRSEDSMSKARKNAECERRIEMEIVANAHEHSQHELEILRLLAQGEKEIDAGKGYDLGTVLAEADALLKEKI